uniref:Cilia and flagella associated protein 206 n=1 Tax=Mus musculus TaxID=10090 RepID=E0CXC1_MOUSE
MPPTQAESVIKNIIREIGQECAAHGEIASETVVAFMRTFLKNITGS